MGWNLRHLACVEAQPGSSSERSHTHGNIHTRSHRVCSVSRILPSILPLIISLHGSSLAVPTGTWRLSNLILHHSVAGLRAPGWCGSIDWNYVTSFYLKIAPLIQTSQSHPSETGGKKKQLDYSLNNILASPRPEHLQGGILKK